MLKYLNYSELVLDDLYHPKLYVIYTWFIYISFVINTIFVGRLIYVVITKSTKEMREYKFYLLHQICSLYALTVLVTACKPVLFWPVALGHGTGITATVFHIPDRHMFYVAFMVCFQIIFAEFCVCTHRLANLSPFSIYTVVYNDLSVRIGGYIICYCCGLLLCLLPVSALRFNDSDNVQEVQSQLPFLDFYWKENIVSGFNRNTYKIASNIITQCMVTFFVLGSAIVACYIYMGYCRLVCKKYLTPATFKQQKLLFKVLIVQMGCMICFLIIPGIFCFVMFMFGVKWTSYVVYAGTMISTLCLPVECTATCYFILRYRQAFFHFFGLGKGLQILSGCNTINFVVFSAASDGGNQFSNIVINNRQQRVYPSNNLPKIVMMS